MLGCLVGENAAVSTVGVGFCELKVFSKRPSLCAVGSKVRHTTSQKTASAVNSTDDKTAFKQHETPPWKQKGIL